MAPFASFDLSSQSRGVKATRTFRMNVSMFYLVACPAWVSNSGSIVNFRLHKTETRGDWQAGIFPDWFPISCDRQAVRIDRPQSGGPAIIQDRLFPSFDVPPAHR